VEREAKSPGTQLGQKIGRANGMVELLTTCLGHRAFGNLYLQPTIANRFGCPLYGALGQAALSGNL
jgi:hypothetical protein